MNTNNLHIPLIQGETVWGPITNITVTIFVFLIFVICFAFFARRALYSNKKSKLKIAILHFVHFFDSYLRETFGGDKVFARRYFPIIVGMFCIIFFGNIFGLMIDWIGLSISEKFLYYFRPMHSDVNTTLVLGSLVVASVIYIQIKTHGSKATLRSYIWNFRGKHIGEKIIHVFVGWLHLIGLHAMLASLSLRLFGNIFSGVVLIGVITFLGATASASIFEVGRILALPFWFFEIFIALIQAIVFTGLMIAYFKNSKEAH